MSLKLDRDQVPPFCDLGGLAIVLNSKIEIDKDPIQRMDQRSNYQAATIPTLVKIHQMAGSD